MPSRSARLACLLALTATSLGAQAPRLTIAPERPMPGALVRLTLLGAGGAGDSVVAVQGTMANEPLHFAVRSGRWRAIGAVPVDSTGPVVARVVVTRASGRVDSLRASVEPPPLPPPS